MNRIINQKLDEHCTSYVDFVEPITRNRLNVAIGVIAVRDSIIPLSELSNESFLVYGKRYFLNPDAFEKKSIIKILLEDSKQVSVSKGEVVFSANSPLKFKTEFISKFSLIESYIFLSENLHELLSGTLDEISNLNDKIKEKFPAVSQTESEVLGAVFNYKNFLNKTTQKENYYAPILAQHLDTPVCPYCNREYITSVKDENGEKLIGPTFDHFLPQFDYPFLVLSFYNLIPSCYTCNSQLKFKIPFDLVHFFYPYADSYEAIANFSVYQTNLKLVGELKTYNELEIVIEHNTIKNDKNNLKLFGPDPNKTGNVKGSLNVFNTQQIYNSAHLTEAKDILFKYKEIPKEHIESTFKILQDRGFSEAEIYRFYFGNYIQEKDFNKKPLARFTRDLTVQLNKIYGLKYLETKDSI